MSDPEPRTIPRCNPAATFRAPITGDAGEQQLFAGESLTREKQDRQYN